MSNKKTTNTTRVMIGFENRAFCSRYDAWRTRCPYYEEYDHEEVEVEETPEYEIDDEDKIRGIRG